MINRRTPPSIALTRYPRMGFTLKGGGGEGRKVILHRQLLIKAVRAKRVEREALP